MMQVELQNLRPIPRETQSAPEVPGHNMNYILANKGATIVNGTNHTTLVDRGKIEPRTRLGSPSSSDETRTSSSTRSFLKKHWPWVLTAIFLVICAATLAPVCATGHCHGATSNISQSPTSLPIPNNAGSTSVASSTPSSSLASLTITTPEPQSTTSSSTPTQTTACIGGTGAAGYAGLCSFCCNYDYCPPAQCTCTAYGAPVPTPPTNGRIGVPIQGEDESFAGLCSYACNHAYCPSSACVYNGTVA